MIEFTKKTIRNKNLTPVLAIKIIFIFFLFIVLMSGTSYFYENTSVEKSYVNQLKNVNISINNNLANKIKKELKIPVFFSTDKIVINSIENNNYNIESKFFL